MIGKVMRCWFIAVSMLVLCPALAMAATAYTKWAVVTDAQFGATGDGVTDDTAAIQKALDTGLDVFFPHGHSPGYKYIVKNQLNLRTKGQIISGHGLNSPIYIEYEGVNAFNMGAAGVFVLSTSATNVVIRDLWIEFAQLDSPTRSKYVRPPAIYARGVTGLTVQDCRIQKAWQGIDLRDNTDGAMVKNLEISSFDAGIMIDGLQGTAHFDGIHFWIFGFANTINYQNVAATYNPVDNVDPNLGAAFRVGDVSDGGMVYISNLMHYLAYGVVMQNAGGVNPRVTINGSWMEWGNCILQLAGELYVENSLLEARKAGPGSYILRQVGGTAVLCNVRGLAWCDNAEAFSIYGQCTITNSCLHRHGSGLESAGPYRIHVYNGGSLVIGNTTFDNSEGRYHEDPWILVDNGGLIQHVGCRYIKGKTLTIAADGKHIVVGNVFGKSESDRPVIPSSRPNMIFENNIYYGGAL